MSRGSYKCYEYDPTASVPKTTSYNKRKRQNYETSVAECFGDICDERFPVSNILVSYSILTFCYISIYYRLVKYFVYEYLKFIYFALKLVYN